ncbi:alpha/beta hydrolase [Streptomyces yunnanensis]|uniref:Alpha/beta hydrolase n=1 Tax=Streptomyces yunnanensis TaxID=156453 RepID=A0A9X8MKV9_9ACTN|nr:alpha/beta hydrolase [Streptomyces yunnanensis]SHK96337.1 Alpha/beta hydrolase [Streptomyces yunnanensis]
MDYTALRNLKTSVFDDAADGYRSASHMASAAKDSLERRITAAMASLSGETTEAAVSQLRELAKDFHYTQIECGVISTALNSLAAELRTAQRKLNQAVSDAEAEQFTVKPDGSIHWISPQEQSPLNPEHSITASDPRIFLDAQRNKAQAHANRIGAALQEATAADEKWAPKLRQLKADDDLTVSAADMADALTDTDAVRAAAGSVLKESNIPKSKSPADNKKWWDGLTQDQRDEYTSLYPANIGALDGLPATVRDGANRVVLAETHGAVQLQLDNWRMKEPEQYLTNISAYPGPEAKGSKFPNPAWLKWNETTEDLEGRLAGMETIESRINASEVSGRTPAYLLGFDNEKLGHAIVSIGNPDTSDNVVTYVPGTGSKLGKINDDMDRADLLQGQAALADQSRKTASILWLGYDAPQDIVPEAMDPKYADGARQPLTNFLTGIDAAHKGRPHSTILGHSYGTLVAGETMRDHPDLPVENAILLGSPGAGVNHARELNIPADHVWAATAENDLINLTPPREKGKWLDDHSLLFGTDPTSNEFGGRTFQVPDGKLPLSDGLMPAHSQYWDEKPLERLAKIVTGGHR